MSLSSDDVYYSKTLYQTGAKGEIRVWNIWVTGISGCDGVGIIHRSHGVLDGKMVTTSRKLYEGKNIGKSNETTPLEQAIFEAKSVVTKKTRTGYLPEKNDDTRLLEDTNIRETVYDVVLPMLAHDYHKQKHGLSFPCYAQPKLDGVRMMVERLKDGSLRMTTRTGKPVFFMDHIKYALTEDVLPVGIVLDGELFTQDKTFEEITGIVRKSVKKHHNPTEAFFVKYHVFDIYNRDSAEMSFIDRQKNLHSICELSQIRSPGVVIEVPTYRLINQDDANNIHERFVGEGHEGTMYRNPNSVYTVKRRTKYLLKRKDFVTDEYRIIGAEEADGRDKGTVVWVVETRNNETGEMYSFNIRPRGAFNMRKKWWDNRTDYIGKLLTVRYQNLTETGIPRFPVGLTIRDYE